MNFLKEIWLLLQDQRGVVGDDINDDDLDDKEDDDEKDDDEDETLIIGPDDDKEDEDDEGDKKKKNSEDDKDDESLVRIRELEKTVQKLETDKTNLNTALHQARQTRKASDKRAGSELSEAELKQILVDNPNDPDVQFNVLKYLSEQTARGASSQAVTAAEVAKRREKFDTFLLERYPDIVVPSSQTRMEVEKTKGELGLVDHPYGDYFAVATRVLEDLPDLLEQAFKEGKEGKSKIDAEKNRTTIIKDSQLGPSKKRSSSEGSLTAGQDETAKQMGLKGTALKTYKKLVGKKANAVSVEGK